jgi:hypothetical protein
MRNEAIVKFHRAFQELAVDSGRAIPGRGKLPEQFGDFVQHSFLFDPKPRADLVQGAWRIGADGFIGDQDYGIATGVDILEGGDPVSEPVIHCLPVPAVRQRLNAWKGYRPMQLAKLVMAQIGLVPADKGLIPV